MRASAGPVYVQIANRLAHQFCTEDDGQPRPSVRRVAREFGVSPVTASRALQLLRERQTPVGDAADETPFIGSENWAVCLHVSPGPHQHAAAQLTEDGFRALAKENETAFDFEVIRFSSGGESQIAQQVAGAVARGVRGLFLLPSRTDDASMHSDEKLIEQCKVQGLPVVLIERNLRGENRPLDHDLVSFYDFEGGRLLAGHLAAQARCRIAFVTASPTSSHVERLAGYLSALHSAGNIESLILHQDPQLPPSTAYPVLAKQLIDWRADGVICYHEYAALGLIVELLRRGKSIPAEIAVAGFYSLGLGESFSIGITSYSFPAATVAARALDTMRWRMKNRTAPPMKVVVPGELIVRTSSVAEMPAVLGS